MVEIPPLNQQTNIKINSVTDDTVSWKVGQILNGTTQQGGDALSKVLIRIGKQVIEANTPITLKNGQDIKLLVKTTVNNTINNFTELPVLSILNTASTPVKNTNLANIKLRQFIASQQSFNKIQTLAKSLIDNINDNTRKQIPRSLEKQLTSLQNTLQTKTQGSNTSQLKQAILNSGIFYESKINSSTSFDNNHNKLSNDFKYQLLSIKLELTKNFIEDNIKNIFNQFKTLSNQDNSPLRNTQLTFIINKIITLLTKTSLDQLNDLLNNINSNEIPTDEIKIFEKIISLNQAQQTTPKLQEQIKYQLMLLELGQQVEQAINKVTSLQLQPMSRDNDNMLLLFFNLIFKDDNEQFDIQYRIQSFENSENNEKQRNNHKTWSVILDFNFKTLGKIQSIVTLNDSHISNTFNTQYKETAAKIKNLLPLLKISLMNCGLNINHLNVENTLSDNDQKMNHINNLLDENA